MNNRLPKTLLPKKITPPKPQQQDKPQPVSTPAEIPAPATAPSVKPDIADGNIQFLSADKWIASNLNNTNLCNRLKTANNLSADADWGNGFQIYGLQSFQSVLILMDDLTDKHAFVLKFKD